MKGPVSTPEYPGPKGSVPDTIIASLRERILRGELEPGQRLPPERELAKNFGTNRTSLREALRALEIQGLVRARQGDGVRVQNFRQSGDISLLPHYFTAAPPLERIEIFGHLLRLRALVMPEALHLAIENGTDDQLGRLDALIDELEAAQKRQDIATMASTELQLYRSLVEASGAVTYLWVFNSLERVVRGFINSQPGVWIFVPNLVDMWRAISTELKARDGARVTKRFADMLATIEEQVKQLLPMFREGATAASS